LGTIVEYTDEHRPANLYPHRIFSPARPRPCCFAEMDEIGEPERDERWLFRYKRCRRCGFTVRLLLEEIPDRRLLSDLREVFAKSFTRTGG
jgi:hypothetical protein